MAPMDLQFIQFKFSYPNHIIMSAIRVFDSFRHFENIQAVGTGGRSRVVHAQCTGQPEVEGQALTEEYTIKKFNFETLFNSTDAKLLDDETTMEEKLAAIPLDVQTAVQERFNAAAAFLARPELQQQQSLLQIKGVIAPRDSISDYGVVFEKFQGVSLENLLAARELENVPFATRIQRLYEIAEALNALHQEDLLHRNLHGANVLFSLDFQQVKVSDYALDTFLVKVPTDGEEEEEEEEDEAPLIAVSEIRTVESPVELLAGAGFNEASDVYCFAMIAWQVLSCKAIETEIEDEAELVQEIARNQLRPNLQEVEKRSPAEVRQQVSQLLSECWVHNPVQRPEIHDVCKKLREIISKL
jgi:serine/threonine protein kinase